MSKLFTSESVGAGHPDKICDQISDQILDELLRKDSNARVAIEVMASNRLIVIGGEIQTTKYVDVVQEAWKVIMPLGYTEEDFTIISNVHEQSKEIDKAITKSDKKIGAGDQGMVFGYACDETVDYMPLAITIAHKLVLRAETLRKEKIFKDAKSDMKSQVTIDYSIIDNPKIHTILMSIQHEENYVEHDFKKFIKNEIIDCVVNDMSLNHDYRLLINPSGSFIKGGPIADTGLTGRKIIVDTYGSYARHGGGCFSGKDCTKIDRSGAYAARWIAKNIVAAGLAKKCELQISYAIGKEKPISIGLETFGTEKYEVDKILEAINEVFDLSPKSIFKELNLHKPIYFQTSTYGHFGRNDLDLPWEKLNKVEKIKHVIKNLTNL